MSKLTLATQRGGRDPRIDHLRPVIAFLLTQGNSPAHWWHEDGWRSDPGGASCTTPFESFTEQYLDSTGVFRYAIIAFLAAIAKQERVRFSKRIKAGQAKSSKKPSRPSLAAPKVREVRRLRAQGLSFKKIQVATGIPVATMHKYLVAKS